MSTSTELRRETLSTSRLLDFFSRKELITQIGHPPEEWPLVIAKELIDNALDACEEARVAPELTVKVDDSGITVADNGPGIPAETVAGICDFSVRVSSREAYIAPDRGAQGNALKTIVAMPFVLTGEEGRVTVTARGKRHEIRVTADRIAQQPSVSISTTDAPGATGTVVHLAWPADVSASGIDDDDDLDFLQDDFDDDDDDDDSASGILVSAKRRFLQIVDNYGFLNPHATITVDWHGELCVMEATNPGWSKWLPSSPTSVHWYKPEHFGRLIAGYIAHDRDSGRERTVRELVAEFDGLTSTRKQKAVLDATGMARASLSSLANCRDLDSAKVESLHKAMIEATKPVTARRLGPIGKDHIRSRFDGIGAEIEESFKYAKKEGVTDGVPWIVETAFAWRPERGSRRLITGVNWSPGIGNPFRKLGRFGTSLDAILANQKADRNEPVVLLLHMTCPRVEYTDRGKSAVVTH